MAYSRPSKPKASGLAKAKTKVPAVARARGIATATRATAKTNTSRPAFSVKGKGKTLSSSGGFKAPDVGKALNDIGTGIRRSVNLGPGTVNDAMTRKR